MTRRHRYPRPLPGIRIVGLAKQVVPAGRAMERTPSVLTRPSLIAADGYSPKKWKVFSGIAVGRKGPGAMW